MLRAFTLSLDLAFWVFSLALKLAVLLTKWAYRKASEKPRQHPASAQPTYRTPPLHPKAAPSPVWNRPAPLKPVQSRAAISVKTAAPFVLLPLAPEPQNVATKQLALPPEDGALWIYRGGEFLRHR